MRDVDAHAEVIRMSSDNIQISACALCNQQRSMVLWLGGSDQSDIVRHQRVDFTAGDHKRATDILE